MPAAARRVCRLRLRGGSEEALHRATRLLEDAMRTASLRDEGGRIVLVRRLALAPVRARARADEVARALEAALEETAADARHGTQPGAASANVVWFADALEAHLALARRLLGGPPPREWYWPLAARAWRPGEGVRVGMRTLARSLAALPEGPSALPAWVAALERDGHGPVVTSALDADDVRALAEAMGWPSGHGAPDGKGRTGAEGSPVVAREEPPPASGASAAHGADGPFTSDARALVDALIRAGGGTPASPPTAPADPADLGDPPDATPAPALGLAPPARARTETQAPGEAWATPGTPGSRPGPAAPLPTESTDTALAGSVGRRHARPTRPPPREADAGDGAQETEAAQLPVAPRWPALQASAAGGIGFVLNILVRLDHGAWLGRRPAWAGRRVAGRVLERVLDGLEVSRDDAMRALARPSSLDEPPAREAAVVRAWSFAAHRWLRRHAGIGMAELVLRPAQVAVSRTHVDVWFDPDLCDLRIRRAGLDLDPGWLPWLGRVVAFHYRAGGRR